MYESFTGIIAADCNYLYTNVVPLTTCTTLYMVQLDWFDFTHFLISMFGILTKNSFKILIVVDMCKVPPLSTLTSIGSLFDLCNFQMCFFFFVKCHSWCIDQWLWRCVVVNVRIQVSQNSELMLSCSFHRNVLFSCKILRKSL